MQHLRTRAHESTTSNRIVIAGLGLLAIALALLAAPTPSSGSVLAAPPEPCLGAAQITDATGDGHHVPTDVVSAWFSEDAGHLQAVIKVNATTPGPDHEDADVNGAGLVMLFTIAGQTKYVRATIPFASDGPPSYDYGTYPSTDTYTSAGATTGEVFSAVSGGSVIIDIPAATGAVPDAVLDDPFVLTYDGIIGGNPTEVDHAPGGTAPGDTARGADYVVDSCGDNPDHTVAVQLSAPAKVKGGKKKALVSGHVVPARAGVAVQIRRQGSTTTFTNTTSAADGSFSALVPITETTRVQATAETISSQTLTITSYSTVHIRIRKLAGGKARISGEVGPWLPGKLLLLPSGAFKPSQTTTKIKNGKFSFLLKRPKPGGYQVVFVPANHRAERSTSNTVRYRR